MTQTETTETYAAGYTAAQTAIAVLSTQLGTEQLRQIARQNIIPVHVRDASEYRHGGSDAWADYLSRQRYEARRNNWRRNRG